MRSRLRRLDHVTVERLLRGVHAQHDASPRLLTGRVDRWPRRQRRLRTDHDARHHFVEHHTRARLDRFVADSDRLQITSYLDLLKHPTADPVALGSVCRPYGNERRTTIPNDGHLTVGRSTYRHEWAARQLRRRAARRQRGPILRSIEPQRAPAGVSGWVPPFCCGG
jgi:hypothetical protein